MARPIKTSVDYFPHDARASDSDTLTIIEGQFGIEGYAFWFKLLERVSCADNLVIDVRNPVKWELLMAKIKTTPEQGTAIINKLAELDAIDKELWDNNRVIWCQKLVDRVADAYRNRKHLIPSKPVIDVRNLINDVRNPATSPKTADKTVDNPQRKGKEIKGNKSKCATRKKYGTYKNVLLSDEDYQELQSLFPDLQERIDYLSDRISVKGYKYSNFKTVLINWANDTSKPSKHGQRTRKPGELATTEEHKAAWGIT